MTFGALAARCRARSDAGHRRRISAFRLAPNGIGLWTMVGLGARRAGEASDRAGPGRGSRPAGSASAAGPTSGSSCPRRRGPVTASTARAAVRRAVTTSGYSRRSSNAGRSAPSRCRARPPRRPRASPPPAARPAGRRGACTTARRGRRRPPGRPAPGGRRRRAGPGSAARRRPERLGDRHPHVAHCEREAKRHRGRVARAGVDVRRDRHRRRPRRSLGARPDRAPGREVRGRQEGGDRVASASASTSASSRYVQ